MATLPPWTSSRLGESITGLMDVPWDADDEDQGHGHENKHMYTVQESEEDTSMPTRPRDAQYQTHTTSDVSCASPSRLGSRQGGHYSSWLDNMHGGIIDMADSARVRVWQRRHEGYVPELVDVLEETGPSVVNGRSDSRSEWSGSVTSDDGHLDEGGTEYGLNHPSRHGSRAQRAASESGTTTCSFQRIRPGRHGYAIRPSGLECLHVLQTHRRQSLSVED
ncbi:uncharacterized protein MONBRDRAFT_10257 [Monosiga brevicollis MX1]|uniref:Uncharacterized protein n=1 Tax=Monosiga brevicollis TaxID=81824 RepID=A9V5P2_MONBE|nr:uncharacterized protein MONBRDRAFT_10257 [Monosiga brevicollis MX1]EDQ87075.1 predicted protein [Monosiga brevicollis MX1]|eukprot:XP_001748018.1 hypothetical protein [Monosiga brevicollis MX1]